ncbi:MAG: DoxX family protein [Bacteroidia bacterium]|nr:DoxX family protein [Bacteroidia bacterium]
MKLNKYNYPENGRDFGLLIMRLGLGALFVMFGYPKLFGGPDTWARLGKAMSHIGIDFLPHFWGFMAGFTELVGGVLIGLGLLFRPALTLLIVTMVVAAASHFGKGEGIGGASHAIEAGIVFISLFLIGPGKFSLDKQLK